MKDVKAGLIISMIVVKSYTISRTISISFLMSVNIDQWDFSMKSLIIAEVRTSTVEQLGQLHGTTTKIYSILYSENITTWNSTWGQIVCQY